MKYFILLYFLLSTNVFSKEELKTYLVKDAQLVIKEKVDGVPVEISFIFDKILKKNFIIKFEEAWGAGVGSVNLLYIKSVDVSVSNKKHFLRLSSYADLFNPAKLSFEIKNKKEFRLTIQGGEASSSYEAVLDFDKEGYLITRKVVHGEFPDEVYEETKYSYNRGNNDL